MSLVPAAPTQVGGARSRLDDVWAVLLTAATNRELRPVIGAWAGFVVAEWAGWIAMLVYAYEHGGPAVTAAVNVAQVLPSASPAATCPATPGADE